MFNNEYIGNIHIHTRYSDGEGSISEVADSARRAGLDFLCINDHDHMSESWGIAEEGFYDKLLVLVGLEIGKRYHHYLAYDVAEKDFGDSQSPQDVISQVNRKGGFGFLAHPFEKGMPFREKSTAYTWNDLTVTGYTGICIWNFTSRWKERIKTPLHGFFYLKFKHQTLKGPSQKTLSFWDELCMKRKVVAVAGSDAHANFFKWGPFRFRPFSYEYLLGTLNIHILLNRRMPKDFHEAKKEVYRAMREGRLFMAHDQLCPAKGFRYDFISDDGSDLFMGEEARFHSGDLVVELPHEGEIRLYKEGHLVSKRQGREAVFRVEEKGVYRVEVYKKIRFFGRRPWIFSNPIYLR